MKRRSVRTSAVAFRPVVAIGALILVSSGALAQTPPAFLPAVLYDTGAAATESAVVADVDRDGHPDVIVAIQNHSFGTGTHGLAAVMRGNGDGTFGEAVTYDSGGGAPFSLAVADLNADGAPDIVMDNFCGLAGAGTCGPGTVGVLLNRGDGTFAGAVSWDLGDSSQTIAIADVNGDGRPDLVAAASFLGVSVLLGNGDGTFQQPTFAGVGPIQARSVAVADMNRDGRLDVVASGSDNSVSPGRGAVAILPGNGDGTFQPPLATYESGVTGGQANAVAVADLDGDGALDVAVANYADRTAGVLLGTGTGGLRPVVLYDSGGPFAWAVAIADVNGDAIPDLAVANYSGTVGVLVGKGDGTFQTARAFTAALAAASVAAADLNHDGQPDLVAANATQTFAVLLNDTCANVPPVVTLAASPTVLWPPNGRAVPVTLSGTMTVSPCAAATTTLSYAVVDEYGLVQPAGPIVPGADGAFSLSIPLQASRRGDDPDGRQYTIKVTAADTNGGSATAASIVTVPHNR